MKLLLAVAIVFASATVAHAQIVVRNDVNPYLLGRAAYNSGLYSPRGDVAVRGYYRPSTGSYVQPYYRTRPDNTLLNNYSTYPNVNPYTGAVGTVRPYIYQWQADPYSGTVHYQWQYVR